MSGISIWHWVIAIIYFGFLVLYFSGPVRVLNRVGFSGWWSLLTLIPVVNLIVFFIFWRAKWPRLDAARKVFE